MSASPFRRRIVWVVLSAATLAVVSLGGGATTVSAATQLCTSSQNPMLAKAMSADIRSAVSGRSSRLAVHVDDASLGLTCSLNGDAQFYAASTVKVLILAALLHKADVRHRSLTSKEQSEARKMITVSNNYAAGVLWYDVGRKALHKFLSLAAMNDTILGSGDQWGLTLQTAHDEALLLELLVRPNSILTASDRKYALGLMAEVVSSQRWGTSAGVGSGYVVQVKNGWLPLSGSKWIVNSLGAFTRTGHDYTMDVLTDHNGTMSYGVATIERIARAVNGDLRRAAR